MESGKQIVRIGVEKLIGHRQSANRMGKRMYGKLKRNIERTGNYEPIVIRPSGERDGFFELLNGRHRVNALRELGAAEVDCVVWNVDDDEAMVLLATLNRLGGRSDPLMKGELVSRLSERFSVRELCRRLAETPKSIERLRNVNKPLTVKKKVGSLLNAVVVFLSDEEKGLVEEAIGTAVGAEARGTSAEKRRRGIVSVCEKFIGSNGKGE